MAGVSNEASTQAYRKPNCETERDEAMEADGTSADVETLVGGRIREGPDLRSTSLI